MGWVGLLHVSKPSGSKREGSSGERVCCITRDNKAQLPVALHLLPVLKLSGVGALHSSALHPQFSDMVNLKKKKSVRAV